MNDDRDSRIRRPGADAPRYQVVRRARGCPTSDGTDVPVQHPVDYLNRMHTLYIFLEYHPQVVTERALAGISS